MPKIIESELSIFAVKADVLVNPVNCVGVMGAGLAREFAWRYPDMLKDYQIVCKNKKLKVGTLHTWKKERLCVVNFPTKGNWRDKSEYSSIDAGMKELVKFLSKSEYNSVAIPRLGCGLGGLDWGTVKSIIMRYVEMLPDDFTVFLFEAKN